MSLHKLTRRNYAYVTALVTTSAAALLIVSLPGVALSQSPDASDWGFYGGDAFGQHYSSLDQIKRENVENLTVAWTYRTGELGDGFARSSKLTFEATPVLAFGLLYLETATNIVIALDPETGRSRGWRYDPKIDRKRQYSDVAARGVTIWEGHRDPKAPGHEKIRTSAANPVSSSERWTPA